MSAKKQKLILPATAMKIMAKLRHEETDHVGHTAGFYGVINDRKGKKSSEI